ncbi:MAG TPA: glycosyltransferase family 4 protein [Blastocatellia bacterium]|nr:glycosyltransferase family 4 protein [Blastocatellia bacterium]
MKILFPYLARWHSANRSRYHQLFTRLCHLGHQVYTLTAPPMGIEDISATDIARSNDREQALPRGMTVSELHAPKMMRQFFRAPIRRTKLLKKGLVSLTSIGQIRQIIEKERIDVLFLYNLPQIPLLRLAEQTGCRVHFDLADDLVAMMEVEDPLVSKVGGSFLARAAAERMISRASTVTVASSVLQEAINRPSLMLPNGADLAELDRADGGAWRSSVIGPTVGFVGAFEYWVDFDLILECASRLPNVRFLLVGGGRQLKRLRERIADLGLTNIKMTGAMPYHDAMNHMAAMDVCLLPFTPGAVSDGSCPLKLFEYAALRKPVVSTSATEVKRIGAGWVSFADDAPSFADAIESFIADRRRADTVGAAGRAVVERSYNWTNLAKQFEEFLLGAAAPGFDLAVEPALQPLPENISLLRRP